MTGFPSPLQEAVFNRFHHGTSWSKLSDIYGVNVCMIRRAYNNWMKNPPESQPQDPSDVYLLLRLPGRPGPLLQEEETLIVDVIRHYVDHNTPLTKEGVLDLVEHYISMLPGDRQREINFINNRPSLQWINSFTSRHDLAYKAMRVIDDKRVQAVTKENICEHIARVKAALKRYNIKEARYVFNMDQSGTSFSKMTGRSLRKVIGPRNATLIHSAVQTRGNLERVTVTPVVSEGSVAHTPIIVYPGVQAHFRRVKETNFAFFSAPLLPLSEGNTRRGQRHYIRLGRKYVAETASLREGVPYFLMIIDGYGSHVQIKTLQVFKENRIIVIAMPSHTSHVLQPLDVSVFSSYKSYLQKKVHSLASRNKVLDAFDIACCISNAYSSSRTVRDITDGFRRTGIWDDNILDAPVQPLKHLFKRAQGRLWKEWFQSSRLTTFIFKEK